MTVSVAGKRATIPFEGADHVVMIGSCPSCGAARPKIQGIGNRTSSHSTVTESARCLECGDVIGLISVEFDTLFGICEDEAVANGPWKVY